MAGCKTGGTIAPSRPLLHGCGSVRLVMPDGRSRIGRHGSTAAEHDQRLLVSLTRPVTEGGFDDAYGKMSTSEDSGHPVRGADARASWRLCIRARAGDELAEAPRRH